MGQMTLSKGWFVICRLRFAMVNLYTKFEVYSSSFTNTVKAIQNRKWGS